jgi:cbb3-type cytochrome oxidase maturation protein
MNVPPAVLLLLAVAACGAALALAAFVWAVRNGQLDQGNAGALVIFDEEEPVGMPTDQLFEQRKP